MAIRRGRFSQPTLPPRRGNSRVVTSEIAEPFLGMRPDKSRHALRPGESADMQDFVVDNGRLEITPSAYTMEDPDAGSSKWGTITDTHVKNVAFLMRGSGESSLIAGLHVSTSSFSVMWFQPHTANSGWTPYLAASDVTMTSGKYDTTEILVPDLFSGVYPAWVATPMEGTDQLPITGPVDIQGTVTSVNSIVNVPNFSSVESSARYVESFDDRLIFAATTTSGSVDRGRRIRWTARGTGTDFTSAGAGFEDINDMTGRITALHAEKDRLLIFSDTETWQATPRRDDYAFDIDLIESDVGVATPKVVATTDVGSMWFHVDRMYRAVGSAIRPLSQSLSHYMRTTPFRPDVAAYHKRTNTLWLFEESSNNTADAIALHLNAFTAGQSDWDDVVWTKQTVPLWDAYTINTAGALHVIGDEKLRENSVVSYLQDLIIFPRRGSTNSQSLYFIRPDEKSNSSQGQPYWTSNVLEGARDSARFDLINEVGLNYDVAGSAVSIWLDISSDLGQTFTNVAATSLPSGRSYLDIATTPIHTRNPILKIRAQTSADSSSIAIDRIRVQGRAWTGRRGNG